MLIKIDNRETTLLQAILHLSTNPIYTNIKIKTEPLPIGDIIICDENEDKLIIERKTVADLLASIKDGRYEEQSYRLNGLQHHNHNIIYLIEGDLTKINTYNKSSVSNEKQMAYSAMISLNYYKGFSVFRSLNVDETALIICNMAYKLNKDLVKKPYYLNKKNTEIVIQNNENKVENEDEEKNKGQYKNENKDENNDEEEDENNKVINTITSKNYVEVIKKIKKDNITPDNIGEIMLCQIPGISSITAIAIMEKYKTISNLIKEIELNEESMKDLSYINSKGQTRKINKTSIANIVKFLVKK